MKKTTLLLVMMLGIFVLFLCAIPVMSQTGPERTITIQGETDPYEVTLYRDKDYKNPIMKVKLPPGVRMQKIAQIDAFPLSVALGSKVGALIFPGYNYSSSLTGTSSYKKSGWGIELPEKTYLVPYFRIKNSTPSIQLPTRITGSGLGRCSLIIHRTDIRDFVGVLLQQGGKYTLNSQLFPLPENPGQSAIIYQKIPYGGPFTLSLVPGGTGGMSGGPSKSPPSVHDMLVTVVSDTGLTLKLPDPQGTTTPFELNKYGIHQISSITIRYVGPFTQEAYSPVKAVRAPSAPPVKTVPDTTQSPIVTQTIIDVSGQWNSSIGLVYDIVQNKDRFSWTVRGSDEKGSGIVNGMNVSVSWSGQKGAGSAQGKISKINSGGKAAMIEWNNGVRFHR